MTFALTTDIVLVASAANGRDHVLLIQRRWNPFERSWALPGGYVETEKHETALAAAYRELEEETRVDLHGLDVTLIQVGFYDTQGRDPRGDVRSEAFVARLATTVEATAADDAADARWWPVDDLPPLAFDHAVILTDAIHKAHDRHEKETVA